MLRLLATLLARTPDRLSEADRDSAAQAERLRRFDARIADILEAQAAKTGAPHSAAARSAAPERRPAPPVAPVTESVTVVLRRQLPIRHAEPPRSWLGGLPMMPDDVEWPRGINPEKSSLGARPLHFVAQIACADLPPELWGGLGPREGWLLFFLDNNASTIDDGEQHRVLHVPALGRERQPPGDIGPVHDGEYTGPSFTAYLDQAEVPSTWRRWPVDLVAFPNQLHHDGPRSFGTPPDFATTLYPGVPVGEERAQPPEVTPFSWRCIAGIRALLETAATAPGALHDNELRLRERMVLQGPLATVVAAMEAKEVEYAASVSGRLLDMNPDDLPPDQRERRERVQRYAQQLRDKRACVAALVARYPTHAAMLDFLETERLRRVEWRRTALQRLRDIDLAIAEIHPDTPLHPEDWAAIRATLEADAFTGWVIAYGRATSITLEERSETTWELVGPRVAAATSEIAADYYVDPARRHLLPADALAKLEPWWRRLYNNRPHRIGGYHDGVQSDAEPGPTDQPLLLQLASDDALQWVWGDGGAIYWFLPVSALAADMFDRADCYLECH